MVQPGRKPQAASTHGLGPRSAQILVSASPGSPHLLSSPLFNLGFSLLFFVSPSGREALFIFSTFERIHGDFLRLLYLLADNKTKLHFRALDEAIDADSEAYCWRRSGFFWRMRASLGLACAQATTLSSQVFGKGNLRSRAGRPSV